MTRTDLLNIVNISMLPILLSTEQEQIQIKLFIPTCKCSPIYFNSTGEIEVFLWRHRGIGK